MVHAENERQARLGFGPAVPARGPRLTVVLSVNQLLPFAFRDTPLLRSTAFHVAVHGNTMEFMNSVTKAAADISDTEVAENDVQSFVCGHGLGPHIETALRLIAEYFNGSAVTMERMRDQEIAEEWVSLHVNVEGELNAILDVYDAFTRAFVASVPPDVIGKIRLSLGTT